MEELLGFPLQQAADGDAGPARHDLADVVRVDLLFEEHRALVLGLPLGRFALGELLLELGDVAVLQFGGPLEVGFALGPLDFHARLLEAFLQFGDTLDGVLLALPLLLHRRGPLPELLELPLERVAALAGGVALVLAQGGELDLQLHDASIDLVDLGRQRVDLDADLRGRLVDQVDRLVGQEAVGDVAVRERGGGDQGAVLDRDFVVHLVAFLEPSQDRDRVLHRGLADVHRLEAPLQGGVLLDVLAVLVERGGADRAQFSAREHRLEQVGGVHGPLRGSRADDRVELVEEQDDRPLGVGDFLEDPLQAFLELPPVGGPCDQPADVERDHAAVTQGLRHVAADDPLGEPLDDRGLAHARLPDQHRVVLGAPAEDLDHAADLVVATDDGVELALLGHLGQIASEALQRSLLLVLGHRLCARRGPIRCHRCSLFFVA